MDGTSDGNFIGSCISRAFDDAEAPCVRAASLAVLHFYLVVAGTFRGGEGSDAKEDDDCMRPFLRSSFIASAANELSAVVGQAFPASSPGLLARLLDVLEALAGRGGAGALATLFEVDAWRPMVALLDAAAIAGMLGNSAVVVEGSLRLPAARLGHTLVRDCISASWADHAAGDAASIQLSVMSLLKTAMRSDAHTCRYFASELLAHGALLRLIVKDVADDAADDMGALPGSCEAPIAGVLWQTTRGSEVLACALSTMHLMLRLPRDEMPASPVAITAASALMIVGCGGGGAAFYAGPSADDVPVPLAARLARSLAWCMLRGHPLSVRYGALATLAAMLVHADWRDALQLDFSATVRGGALDGIGAAVNGLLRETFESDEDAVADLDPFFEDLGMQRGPSAVATARTMTAYAVMAFMESGARAATHGGGPRV